MDLWMRLNELVNRRMDRSTTKTVPPDFKKAPPYLWTVVDFALLAIEEQDFLSEEQIKIPLQFRFSHKSHEDDLLIDDR